MTRILTTHSLAAVFVILGTLELSSYAHGPRSKDHDKLIAMVERGLTPLPRFKGDRFWTIEERMLHYGVPGMSIAVIEDSQIAWTKAYGVKDMTTLEPVTTETLFQCASISKPVTSAAALRMADREGIDIHADVNQHLRSWKLPGNEFTQRQHVSLKQLLSHTAGVTVHGFAGYEPGESMPTLIQILDGEAPSKSAAIRVDKLPGEGVRYSGGGYCIVQQMMEDQQGIPFADIMQELVFEPLEMTASTFEQPLPPTRLNEAAMGYFRMNPTVRRVYPMQAPAGMWTTPRDLAKFLIEIQLAYAGESDKLLSLATAKMMVDDAVGIFVRTEDGEVHIGHGGRNDGFVSELGGSRDRGHGLVILTNADESEFIDEVTQSVARAYGWPAQGAPEYKTVGLSPSQIKKIVGRYERNGELVTFFQKEGAFYYKLHRRAAEEVVPIAENVLAFREDSAVACFVTDEDTGQQGFVFKQTLSDDLPLGSAGRKLTDDERLPVEWLLEGDFNRAKNEFLAVMAEDPKARSIEEEVINELGYHLISDDQLDLAIDTFRLNTILHPDAYNTYDSLGEAYLLRGDDQQAVENYEKSLELNPQNEYAIEALRKLASRQRVNEWLHAPQDWRHEVMVVPTEFAPNMDYSGVEHLRFSPETFDADSDWFCSYLFVIDLDQPCELDRETIQSQLLTYFRGLASVGLATKNVRIEPNKFTIEADEGADTAALRYRLHWQEPFVGSTHQTLHLAASVIRGLNEHGMLFVCASPQPDSSPVWQELIAIRADFERAVAEPQSSH